MLSVAQRCMLLPRTRPQPASPSVHAHRPSPAGAKTMAGPFKHDVPCPPCSPVRAPSVAYTRAATTWKHAHDMHTPVSTGTCSLVVHIRIRTQALCARASLVDLQLLADPAGTSPHVEHCTLSTISCGDIAARQTRYIEHHLIAWMHPSRRQRRVHRAPC